MKQMPVGLPEKGPRYSTASGVQQTPNANKSTLLSCTGMATQSEVIYRFLSYQTTAIIHLQKMRNQSFQDPSVQYEMGFSGSTQQPDAHVQHFTVARCCTLLGAGEQCYS